MKILFLAKYINNSGVTTHMLDLSKKYIDKGHEVALLSGGSIDNEAADNFIKTFENIGVKIITSLFPTKKKKKYKEIVHYGISVSYTHLTLPTKRIV